MKAVVYRHAAYDTPWWASPSSRSGRFHRAETEIVQYLCLHPFGPAAEMLRHNVGPDGDPGELVLNLWTAALDIEEFAVISFANCEDHGIAPDELVGDDYALTQALADRCRANGASGIVVPSAALPGADNIVLFGRRVAFPYLWQPISREDVQTGHLTDGARPPAEVRDLVRWMGEPHSALEYWRTHGEYPPLDDTRAHRF